MRKTILVLLALLAISLVIAGCAEQQTVDLTDDEGNVVGQAVRYAPGKYKSPLALSCTPKSWASLCPNPAEESETPVPGDSCGLKDDGCGGKVQCGDCLQWATGLTCSSNTCVKPLAQPNLQCLPKTASTLCPNWVKGETAVAGQACGSVNNGCGGSVECGTCGDPSLTGLTCKSGVCAK